MSSTSHSSADGDLERAERLKREILEFVTNGPLKNQYQQHRDLFFQTSPPRDQHESESVLDWFLFDWLDDQGEGVIEHFLSKQDDSRHERDIEILLDWENSINSVFEIRSHASNTLKLRELDSKDEFQVSTTTKLDKSNFKRGDFIISRLLPLGDDFIFAGLQFVMPDRESAEAWLEMRQALDSMDSPEAIEKAQREQCKAFCELFGCEELTVDSQNLSSTLARFQNYLLVERRDPETGQTTAERFKSELGEDLVVPEMPPVPDHSATREVTILCDEFDGVVLLPDFQRFKSVFATEGAEKSIPNWQELVWNYIKDPDIPIVAFERVAEQYPARVQKIMRAVLGDKKFSLEHLYAVLLHYKEPADGFEDMQDDVELWDLFNGNAKPSSSKPGASKPAKAKKASASKKPAKRKTTSSKKSASVKRAAAKPSKTAKARKTSAKRKPKAIAARSRSGTAAGRNKPSTKKRAKAGARTARTKSARTTKKKRPSRSK